MIKLNDEQLSRVLSAHESDELSGVRGLTDPYEDTGSKLGCLMQVAMNDCAIGINSNTNWYDQNRYKLKELSTDELLKEFELVGIA